MPLSTDRVADTAKAVANFAKVLQNAHKTAEILLKYNATQNIAWNNPKVFTATNATEVLTATAHGLLAGQKGRVTNSGGALPVGLLANTDYFLITVTANTFQLSLTVGGAAVTFTTDGTGTHTFHPVPNEVIQDALGNISGLPYSPAEVSNAIGSVQEFVDLMNNQGVTQGDHAGNLNKLATAPN